MYSVLRIPILSVVMSIRATTAKTTSSSVCRDLTQRVAEYVGTVLFERMRRHDEALQVKYVKYDEQPDGDQGEGIIQVMTHHYTLGRQTWSLLTPFFGVCKDAVDPLSSLLYAHYLLSRAWIIHKKENLDPFEMVDQLNQSLRDKVGALMDPFGEMPSGVSSLAGFNLPEPAGKIQHVGQMIPSQETQQTRGTQESLPQETRQTRGTQVVHTDDMSASTPTSS